MPSLWLLCGQLSKFLFEGDIVEISRTMGLDVGDKTIGVAVSDPLGLTAQGVEVISRRGLKVDIARIQQLVESLAVALVIVGLPRSLNNTLGPQAEKVQEFVRQLEKRLKVPIQTVDERFTTTIAERSMIEGDISRKKRRLMVDRLAAQIILQGHLDRMHRRKDG